ncbi:MAG TPA: cation:dicarboxylase symporter family transporter, partial [Candidatus Methylacidiphilales bacterium]|nr:cation:dicarboxylase symporter family transporter [Candidatus Methylacidiphilales bacterium]
MASKSALLSLAQVAVAAVLGIFTGLFLGDYAVVFRPIGQIYIMLLEAAVYPYLIASLLHGLGSMAPDRAWRLFQRGWPCYLLIWGVTFGLLALLSLAIPQPQSLSIGAGTSALSGTIQRLIALLVPSDFFTALSGNSVPAVVVFCIAFGTALQQMKDKQALLTILDGIRSASFTFWSFVVRMVPVAVFSLLADTAGTIHLQNLRSILLFLFLFYAGVIVLAFWIIPGCLQALTPLKYPEVIANLRSALLIALVTTLPASAIPFVLEATRNLAVRCGIDDADRDDVARAHLSVAYPLGQLGNFFVYLYILFAAFACSQAIPATERYFLPVMTLLSCFGTPASSVNAVTFLGNSFNLPASVNDLFVELLTILRYGQVVASVMGYAFLSFTVILAYYGKLRVRWVYLAAVLLSGAAIILGIAFSTRAVYTRYFEDRPNPYLAFTLDPAVTRGIEVSYAKDGDATVLAPGDSAVARIARTGTLRVGYNAGVIPFCYRNAAGDLVGFDVAFAYHLARELNVRLQFVPYEWSDLEPRLRAGAFDVAISGIYVTGDRLLNDGVSDPYYRSPLAFFTIRERAPDFLTRERLQARPNLRIGIFDSSVL